MIKVSAFRWVPPFAQGLVRDIRVRWALEEAGLAYEQRLIGQADQKSESYRGMQPFGQVPSFEYGGLKLFESGAIVMHIAEQSEALTPSDPAGRARVRTWIIAALNTVEPPVQNLAAIDLFHAEKDWAKAPAGSRRSGQDAIARPVRLARRAGLSGGSLHGGRPHDDDRAAQPAADRLARRIS